jgi:hypothetical protein
VHHLVGLMFEVWHQTVGDVGVVMYRIFSCCVVDVAALDLRLDSDTKKLGSKIAIFGATEKEAIGGHGLLLAILVNVASNVK